MQSGIILAYGQTSSGKTYTMYGALDEPTPSSPAVLKHHRSASLNPFESNKITRSTSNLLSPSLVSARENRSLREVNLDLTGVVESGSCNSRPSSPSHQINASGFDQPGIVPTALEHLLALRAASDIEIDFKISCLEIYNETVYDLLGSASSNNNPFTPRSARRPSLSTSKSTSNLEYDPLSRRPSLKPVLPDVEIREDPKKGFYAPDMTLATVDCLDDAFALIKLALSRRMVKVLFI